MNMYRQERIDMIAAMMMALTGISEKRAVELLESTIIYKNIIDGEECTLYESYSANLEDAADELRGYGKWTEVEKITEDSVSGLNIWMRENRIKNAGQLKENMYKIYVLNEDVGAEYETNRVDLNAVGYASPVIAYRGKAGKRPSAAAGCKRGKTICKNQRTGKVACRTGGSSLRKNSNRQDRKLRGG